jgi:hypothetical protein
MKNRATPPFLYVLYEDSFKDVCAPVRPKCILPTEPTLWHPLRGRRGPQKARAITHKSNGGESDAKRLGCRFDRAGRNQPSADMLSAVNTQEGLQIGHSVVRWQAVSVACPGGGTRIFIGIFGGFSSVRGRPAGVTVNEAVRDSSTATAIHECTPSPVSPPGDGVGAGESGVSPSPGSGHAGGSLAAPPRADRGGGRWEEDDGYSAVVVRSGDTRVINCKDDIHWIVQRLSRGRWRSDKFCRSRAGLLYWAGPLPPDALAVLEALPEWHP